MQKKIEDFFREINNGKTTNAQKVIAKALKINRAAVSKWTTGKAQPSEDNIIKMAKAFNKSEDEIQKIFAVNSVVGDNNIVNTKEMELKDREIELQKREIEVLKRELEVWKLGYTMGVIKEKRGKK